MTAPTTKAPISTGGDAPLAVASGHPGDQSVPKPGCPWRSERHKPDERLLLLRDRQNEQMAAPDEIAARSAAQCQFQADNPKP